MRTKFAWYSAVLLLFAGQLIFAQVSGVVVDSDGFADEGASVKVKGKDVSTTTDADGVFSIDAIVGEDVLEIESSTGDATWEVNVDSENLGELANKASVVFDEVVILGYDATTTKAKSIGAQTTVSAATIENRPNASVLNSLQGQAPGVTVASTSGSPGSARIDVLVRGVSSINANTSPLYVIDGVPTNNAQFRNLNPNEIESVSVLRDAASTSIYGNRGANGVVVITTKRGRFNSALKIETSMITGVNMLPQNDFNLANAQEKLTIENRAGVGLGATLTEQEIAAWDVDTDWLDEFFTVGTTRQYNLGLSQGGDQFRFSTNLGYFSQEGQVQGTDFQRFSARTNVDGKSANEKLTFGVSLGLGYSRRNQLEVETRPGINANGIQNPLQGATQGLPYFGPSEFQNGQELFDAIGSNFAGINDTRVLEDYLRPGNYPSRRNELSVLANATATYQFTDYLSFTQKVGLDYRRADGHFARAPQSYLAIVVAAINGEEFAGFEDIFGSQFYDLTSISSINFNKTFADAHNLNVSLFYEYNRSEFTSTSQRRNGLIEGVWEPGSGVGYVPFDPATPNSYQPGATASKATAGLLSYFANLNYDYKSKYGLSGTIRRDGSYRFSSDNRWGTFWSVGARWNIDKEPFMEGSGFDLLKLRASYGTQGNQNLAAVVSGTNAIFAANQVSRSLFGNVNTVQNQVGLGLASLGNSDVTWEEISQFNVGLDVITFKNRLRANVDFYIKDTDNLFNDINLSAITGQATIRGNNGKLRNRGVELNLSYDLIRNDNFNFTVFGNGAFNDNEVLELIGDVDRTGSLINQVGGVVNEWNLIRYVGANPSNGELLFLDANGNLTENPTDADRVSDGKSTIPRFVGGFGFNMDYKGFFLDAQFSYAADVWRWDNQLFFIYDSSLSNLADDNVSADLLNAWTPENPTNFPRLNAGNQGLEGNSDRYLTDASFVRLRNVQFGYNFPRKLLESSFVKSIRLFAQGENLLVWSKWRGWDPEGLGTFPVGIYPNPRTISFGAEINF